MNSMNISTDSLSKKTSLGLTTMAIGTYGIYFALAVISVSYTHLTLPTILRV